MTDLEQQLTEHLRRRAAAATPRYDLEDIEQGTGLVSLVDLDDRPSGPPTSATTRVALEPRMTSHRWRVVAAAAAVIVLAAAAVLAYRSGDDTTDIEPADVTDVTSTTDPAVQLAVADSFMDAWVAGDGDAVVALIGDPLTAEDSGYIEPGQEFSPVSIGLVAGPGPGSAIGDVAALRALPDWFRAVGWELRREPCGPVGGSGMPEVADSANFVCNYTYENDLTRAAGRGSVTELLDIMVVGDEVAEIVGGMFDLDADLWLMFSDWVRSEHPDDVAAMYRSSAAPPTPRLDGASIALWERHVDEFVASPVAHTPPSAELTRAQFGAKARMICAAHTSWWTPFAPGGGKNGSQQAMEELRMLPRPEEDRAEIDELMSLLEDINDHVVAGTSYHNNAYTSLQEEKDALGGRDFWGCPVPLFG